ncbi:MAG: ThuA domain-containing protein [Pirellulaceae bacterium]|nr:ThuA domain-containing protein [Planctomycetales bacterium]
MFDSWRLPRYLSVGLRRLMLVACLPLVLLLIPIITLDQRCCAAEPVKILLITGGCCHDYQYQSRQLANGSEKLANVKWTVMLDPRTGTRGKIDLYNDPEWAKPYDVVVHNECFADTDDADYIRKITEAHQQGMPAVVIHCAMHTYRATKIDDWRELLGVTSMHHEHQSEYPVTCVAPDHPIMKGFPETWKTPRDELYIIRKVWPNTVPLATSKSERSGDEQPVFWTNQYGKARVFGTTYGHGNATFDDPVFIRTVTRGILWAADKLDQEHWTADSP